MSVVLRLGAAAALFAGGLGLLRVHDAAPGVDYMSVPAASTVRLMAAGVDNIAADGLFLQFVHYFGRHLRDKQAYHNVYPVVDLMTDLDPHFEAAYVMGAMALGDNKQADESEAIWKKGVARNPGEWRYPYQAGMALFLFGDTPAQYERAAALFRQAAALPGAPASARFLEARMFDVANRRGMATDLWRQMYLRDPSPEARAVAARSLRRLGVPLPRRNEAAR